MAGAAGLGLAAAAGAASFFASGVGLAAAAFASDLPPPAVLPRTAWALAADRSSTVSLCGWLADAALTDWFSDTAKIEATPTAAADITGTRRDRRGAACRNGVRR